MKNYIKLINNLNSKKLKNKRENAITLIALVITIVLNTFGVVVMN